MKNFIADESKLICGLDEAGRGPWAGPLIACAVILKRGSRVGDVRDSKKMTRMQREKVYKLLIKKTAYGIGCVTNEEIDDLGLSKCVNLVFNRALENLIKKSGMVPDFLLIDGRDKLTFSYPFKTVVGGDDKIKTIACASVIAKVERDKIMGDFAKKYPHYGFDEHKGYGTPMHKKKIAERGICSIHRRSYEPIRIYLKKSSRIVNKSAAGR